MPSKLKKAIGAVKDQTSISFAKVSPKNSSNIDVAVLKATTHDEIPIEERYVTEVLLLTSSSKKYATICAQAISKRITRTRNWIVALKSLMLVLRIFQDGGPYFPQEVFKIMKRGSKILNLSGFRDDSNSSPWDFTAFVRTFSLYLDERLNCYLTGKLQRRDPCNRVRQRNEPVRDMNPPMLLDRITHWQRLLDRVLATRPTGAAKTNRLILISLYSVVQESFDLYRDVSDVLALLLDSFFHLQYLSCVDAFQTCLRASKQFEEISAFYTLCKSIGVGRMSEYPSVQKISDELIETLREFLKDQSSFPNCRNQGSRVLLITGPREASEEQSESLDQIEGMSSERDSELGSELLYDQRTSIGDLRSVTDAGTSPSLVSVSKRTSFGDLLSVGDAVTDDGTSPSAFSGDQEQIGDLLSGEEPQSSNAVSFEEERNSGLDVLFFDDRPQKQQEIQHESVSGSVEDTQKGWEIVLAETVNTISSTQSNQNTQRGFDPSFLNSLYDHSTFHQNQNQNNPFLQGTNEIASNPTTPTAGDPAVFPVADPFSSFFAFPATSPTFSAKNSENTTATNQIANDPFAPYTPRFNSSTDQFFDGSMNQQHLQHEQQLWKQNQNKIIGKHMI